MDARALEAWLLPRAGSGAMPRWAHVHTERRRKGDALSPLWQEHKAEHPDGIRHRRLCERCRALRQGVDGVMRQPHRAGETPFVDSAGHTAPVVDRESGAPMFGAGPGASRDLPADAGTPWTQTRPDRRPSTPR